MKALEILNNINVWGDVTEVEEQINEAIVEIEALEEELKMLKQLQCLKC